MPKIIPEGDSYIAKTTKKENQEFADLWNKKNVKIASELQKTMNAEKITTAKTTHAEAKKSV